VQIYDFADSGCAAQSDVFTRAGEKDATPIQRLMKIVNTTYSTAFRRFRRYFTTMCALARITGILSYGAQGNRLANAKFT